MLLYLHHDKKTFKGIKNMNKVTVLYFQGREPVECKHESGIGMGKPWAIHKVGCRDIKRSGGHHAKWLGNEFDSVENAVNVIGTEISNDWEVNDGHTTEYEYYTKKHIKIHNCTK